MQLHLFIHGYLANELRRGTGAITVFNDLQILSAQWRLEFSDLELCHLVQSSSQSLAK